MAGGASTPVLRRSFDACNRADVGVIAPHFRSDAVAFKPNRPPVRGVEAIRASFIETFQAWGGGAWCLDGTLEDDEALALEAVAGTRRARPVAVRDLEHDTFTAGRTAEIGQYATPDREQPFTGPAEHRYGEGPDWMFR